MHLLVKLDITVLLFINILFPAKLLDNNSSPLVQPPCWWILLDIVIAISPKIRLSLFLYIVQVLTRQIMGACR